MNCIFYVDQSIISVKHLKKKLEPLLKDSIRIYICMSLKCILLNFPNDKTNVSQNFKSLRKISVPLQPR